MEVYEKKSNKKKTKVKWLVLLGIVLFVIGIIVTIFGILMGGSWSNIGYSGETKNIEETYQGVEKIIIESDFGTVRIQEGETFSIKGMNVSKNGFSSKVKNGEWIIEDKNKSIFSLLGIQIGLGYMGFNDHIGDTELVITVPENFKAEDLDIKIGGGELFASNLRTDDFQLKIGAGQGTISGLIVSGESEIKVGAGQITMEEVQLKDTELDCGAGEIEVKGDIQGDCEAKCGVGEIGLVLSGRKEDYNYDVKCGIGEIDIDGEEFSNEDKKAEDNNGTNYDFRLKCGVGRIYVDFY